MHNIIKKRNIKRLFHFTQIANVVTILKNGIIPQETKTDYPLLVTDKKRLDRRLDCVSVSLSFPNAKMFYPIRRYRNPYSTWCVISLSADILTDLPCLFFPGNAAAYGHETNRSKWKTTAAFEAIFTGNNRPMNLPASFPTDVQAEIQVEKEIPRTMISGVHFENDNDAQKFLSINVELPDDIKYWKHPELFCEREIYLKKGYFREG
jgi:hypothetical protein